MKTQYTADKPAKADQAATPAASNKNSGSGNGFSLAALAVAIAAAGGTWYNNSQLGSQVGQLQQVIGEQNSSLQSALSKQSEQASTAASGLDERATALEEQTINLQGATKALSGDIESARTALTQAMESKATELTTTLETRSAELLAQLTEARESLSQSLDSRSQEITGLVETRTSELSNSLQDTQMKLNRNQRSWLLSEVEYLLRTSVHRVMLAGDTDSAVEALKAAKSQLSVLGEVEYLPVTQEIGEEITELRSTDQPDIEQLILDLRALSEQSSKLRMAKPAEEAPVEETATTETAEAKPEPKEEGLGSMVSGLFSNIQQHISVKTPEGTQFGTGDKNAVFAPTTEESTNAELVKLNLQAAQLAALRRDQNDYTAQLDKARANVKSIYDTESEITTAFIKQIDLLTEKTVVPYTERLGGALRLLRETNKKLGAN